MYFWTTQHVKGGLELIKDMISSRLEKISIPLPWFAFDGFTNQMLFTQCLIGILSFGAYPLVISLNL